MEFEDDIINPIEGRDDPDVKTHINCNYLLVAISGNTKSKYNRESVSNAR